MRGLAEYVVKGRSQAVTVAAIAAALPLLFWLSAATIALITLRKGWQEGLHVLLWSSLPAAVWAFWQQDPTALLVMLGTAGMAAVLRQTVSWVYALLAGVVAGIITSGLLPLLLPDLLAQLVSASQQVLEPMREQLAEQLPAQLQGQLDVAIGHVFAGFFGMLHLWLMVACLVLGRWWQSLLFNPGGFQAEFHQLRLPKMVALPLLVALLIGGNISLSLLSWVPVLTVPLVLAGIALVHGLVKLNGLGQPWLVVFYIGLVFIEPYFYMLLILVASLDSWLDFRAKAARSDA